MEYKLLVLSSVDSVHVSPVSGQSRPVHEKQPWKSSPLAFLSLYKLLFESQCNKV